MYTFIGAVQNTFKPSKIVEFLLFTLDMRDLSCYLLK